MNMLVYDSLSVAFSQKAEKFLKEILTDIGIQVRRSRFVWKNYTYPIHVVIFEGPELGHFNAPYLQIGLSRQLIYSAKDSVLRDILKHELAHYLTYIRYGDVPAHGPEFRSVCLEYGFPQEVANATMNLAASNESKMGDINSERILEKVKKLLKLAQSSNVHEAELATVKANQILLRYNLDQLDATDAPILYLDRLLPQKRKDSKLTAIYDILRHFVVRTVISQGKDTCCLEVSGNLTNVKLARYVAEFLDRELEHLWSVAKKEHTLKGLRSKNSFFLGVAKGFDQKMQSAKAGLNLKDQKALVLVEQRLIEGTDQIYRHLSKASSGQVLDRGAQDIGIQSGKSLSIRQGVEGKQKNLYLN
jgi:predicted metal-dependent hydrolase